MLASTSVNPLLSTHLSLLFIAIEVGHCVIIWFLLVPAALVACRCCFRRAIIYLPFFLEARFLWPAQRILEPLHLFDESVQVLRTKRPLPQAFAECSTGLLHYRAQSILLRRLKGWQALEASCRMATSTGSSALRTSFEPYVLRPWMW